MRLKTPDEIDKIRQGGQILKQILDKLAAMIVPGVSTLELDRVAEELIRKAGAIPAFKGYLNYPNALCASVNEGVVHGIPSSRRLVDGDIVGLDLGVYWQGFYSDSAITVSVGDIGDRARRLIEVSREALYLGISQARDGNRLGDISHAVQSYVEANGFSVVREFVGHGIGRRLQEEPQIPNYGLPGRGVKLKPGMVLAIEPMVNMGGASVKVLADGWTAVTQDGSLSAHFEHTIVVTNGDALILTE